MNTQVKTISRSEFANKISIAHRIGRWIAPIMLFLSDYFAITLALFSAYILRENVLAEYFNLHTFPIKDSYLFIVVPMIYLTLITYEGMYVRRVPFWQCAETMFKICSYAMVVNIGVMYFTDGVKELPRIFITLSWILCYVYIVIFRYILKRALVHLGLWQKPVVIIGAGKTAELIAKAFEDEPGLGYTIVGVIEDNVKGNILVRKYPVLGTFNNVEQAVACSGVADVIIAAPGLSKDHILEIVNRIQPLVKKLTIVPNLVGMPLLNLKLETLCNQRLVLLNVHNNLESLFNRCIKRIFDVIVGVAIFIVIVPILLILAILIKFDSSGPMLHVAKRLGKNGEEFFCYKFRTMYVNADDMLNGFFQDNSEAKTEWSKYQKLRNGDPRVTKVGAMLRKYSLDELPQIFNVLLGNMSLVGPRPYLPREKEMMGHFLQTILKTVPGITGLWQVSGRNEIEFEGRLHLDMWYVRNWSLWQDIMLLFKTVKVVLVRKGAY